jgi:hypothetical protein
MSNFFGSIKPKPEYREVVHQWMPLWSYHFYEIEEIKEKAIKYDHDTYTILEEIPQETNYYKDSQC